MQANDVPPAQLAFASLVPITIPAESCWQPVSKQICSSRVSAAVLGAVTARQAPLPNPHAQGSETPPGGQQWYPTQQTQQGCAGHPGLRSPGVSGMPGSLPTFLSRLFAGGRNLTPDDTQDLTSSLFGQCQIFFQVAFQRVSFRLLQ